jgi:hypothetical protein
LNPADNDDQEHHCHNCGAVVHYHYCALCGQGTTLHVPSAGEFLHEFVGHYVALEGRLWQSLWMLVRKPGMLTAEYLAGRRIRYVEPLRLYLTFSIIFFALFKLSGISVATVGDPESTKPALVQADERDMAENKALLHNLGTVSPTLGQKVERFGNLNGAEKTKFLGSAFFSYAPYALFCLMPVFALYLKLLYAGSRRRYGEHLLFALHTNAFAYLAMVLAILLPVGFLTALMVFWLLFYLPLAMQRVYGGPRWATLLRWLALATLHGISIAIAIAAALALAVVS